MKMNLLTIGAVALAVCATQQGARATLITSGTADFTSTSDGSMVVSYDVFFNANNSLYTYFYAFTPVILAPTQDNPDPGAIGQFTVNAGYVLSVFSAGDSVSGDPGVPLADSTLTSITESGIADNVDGVVTWTYNPYATTAQLVGFTSSFGPANGSGSLNDHGLGPWGDSQGNGEPILIPAPVPEASTVMAGALMLLPFGIGAIRSLRKERIS